MVLAATEKSNPVHIAASSPICAGRSSSSVHSTLVTGADIDDLGATSRKGQQQTHKQNGDSENRDAFGTLRKRP